MKLSRGLFGLAIIVYLAGCKSDPIWTTSNLVSEVRIISDSADVRQLISHQEIADASELHWLQDQSSNRDDRVQV